MTTAGWGKSAKVEGKDAMNKNLTDMGKYYKDHDHSLDGYKK